MNPSRPIHQSKHTVSIGKRADHFEDLDIESLEELFDPRFIRLNFLRTLLTTYHIDLDGRLKWATQRRGPIGERFVGLKFWQGLDRAFRLGTNLIHECLQVGKIISRTAPLQKRQQTDRYSQTKSLHLSIPLSL